MPMNVTYEYTEAEKRFNSAKTTREKISALQEMIRALPKHKGTENMLAILRTRLAKLKRQQEAELARKGGRGPSFSIRKEGGAQIVLVGYPNAGKSSLLNRLTGAKVEIGHFAFTTLKPEVGMIDYDGAKVQLVEVPGLISGASRGKGLGKRFLSSIRNGDAIVILLDAGDKPADKLRILFEELREAGIRLNRTRPDVRVEGRDRGGIELMGAGKLSFPEEDAKRILREAGIINATVIIRERMDIDDLLEALDPRITYKPALIALNKVELGDVDLGPLRKEFPGFPFVKLSVETGRGLDVLREEVFKLANIIRVYTKPSDGEADLTKPLTLRKGSTVLDVAKGIHKDFYRSLKFARVWGSTKYDGQRVNRDYILKDKDVVELHI